MDTCCKVAKQVACFHSPMFRCLFCPAAWRMHINTCCRVDITDSFGLRHGNLRTLHTVARQQASWLFVAPRKCKHATSICGLSWHGAVSICTGWPQHILPPPNQPHWALAKHNPCARHAHNSTQTTSRPACNPAKLQPRETQPYGNLYATDKLSHSHSHEAVSGLSPQHQQQQKDSHWGCMFVHLCATAAGSRSQSCSVAHSHMPC